MTVQPVLRGQEDPLVRLSCVRRLAPDTYRLPIRFAGSELLLQHQDEPRMEHHPSTTP